jgi:hypothetical protein
MPSPREQYGGTVHLFIGTGHSSYKITPMPFTFGSNSIVIHRGLNSLFIFKSVSSSAITPKLSYSQLRCCVDLRILWVSPTVVPIRVRRYLFTHYTPETSLNHVFEDLRRPKAPNINKHGPTIIVPEVGMSFESGENAYEMYNSYVGKVGFSIRKSDTKRRVDKTMSLKLIVCSKQGHGDTSSSHGTTRTGCHARILFSISREGIWTVQQVEFEHNHYLASPSKTHMLRSQRHVMEADRKIIS